MASYPELSGRVVVVTGAAQGIGAVTARAFAEQKASVALLDIDGAGAKKVADAIAPITTLTPRVAALRTEAELERIASLVPLKRLAEPEDHAQAMLFLASDAASYLNGITLDVNGGRVMM